MLKWLGQVFLAERQLANGPDLGILFRSVVSRARGIRGQAHRLERLLDIAVQRASLDGNDFRGRIGVMGNGRAALRTEDTVDSMARRAVAGVLFGRAINSQLGLGNDGNKGFYQSA